MCDRLIINKHIIHRHPPEAEAEHVAQQGPRQLQCLAHLQGTHDAQSGDDDPVAQFEHAAVGDSHCPRAHTRSAAVQLKAAALRTKPRPPCPGGQMPAQRVSW
jgi:hypothetical protein